MDVQTLAVSTRRPRFRRASEPPAFRLTDDDVHIVRQLARHRFLKSTHIAALVGRSLDRTNDRLLRLFHAGYIDRPRAQLDYYPTAGSSPIAYALADRGARLLIQRDDFVEGTRGFARPTRQRRSGLSGVWLRTIVLTCGAGSGGTDRSRDVPVYAKTRPEGVSSS